MTETTSLTKMPEDLGREQKVGTRLRAMRKE